jgi:putative acetyltransferase
MRARPTIRALTPEDTHDVARVLGASYGWSMPETADCRTPAQKRMPAVEPLFGSAEMSGAFSGDELIGYIAWRPNWVDHLYVVPEHTERGIGTALLDAVKAQQQQIDLWTVEGNTLARRFYEARGFVEIERTDGGINDQQEPDVLYRWFATVAA